MTNSKITRRALLISVVALMLCLAMLTGTTFAWFTDQETSANNKIVAGDLDVQLLMYDETAQDYVDIGEESDPIFGADGSLIAQNNNLNTLWEPGKTQVAYLAIKNNGSLALKYKVELEVEEADTKKLYEVMSYAITPGAQNVGVTAWDAANAKSIVLGTQAVSGEVELEKGITHYFALSVHMDENAGNSYENAKISFDLTVYATQLNVEPDAFGPDYDKDALFAVADDLYIDQTTGEYVATSTAGLSSIAALAGEDDTITSVNYNGVDVPVVSDTTELATAAPNNELVVLASGNYQMPDGSDISLRGKTLTTVGTKDTVVDVSNVDARDQFVTGATVLFEGVTLNFGSSNYMGFANTASLTYKDCKINGLQFLFGDNVTFENCEFNSNGAEHSVWTYGAKNVSFKDCSFTYGDRAINCYSDNDVSGGKQTVDFTNCTFEAERDTSEGAIEINSYFFSVGIEVNVNNCTAPAYGQLAYVSRWDSTNGAKTTINIR